MAPIYEPAEIRAGVVPQARGTMAPIYDAQDLAQRAQLVVPPDGKPYVLKAPAN